MSFGELVTALVITVGAISRIKYVWVGNKIRRQKSTRDASCKFLFITHIIYWIMLIHNINQVDLADAVFWFIGLFTTAYANIMAYRYSERRGLDYLRYMFRSEAEGGVWR